MDSTDPRSPRSAAEAGWHASRYNLYAKVSGSDKLAVYNTLNRTCFEYSTLEAYALESLGDFSENHPLIARMAHQGAIARHDERAAHLAQKLAEASAPPHGIVSMIVCPTLACNFDCPYCFESRRPGKMSPEVQDDVVALAGRMLDADREAYGALRVMVNCNQMGEAAGAAAAKADTVFGWTGRGGMVRTGNRGTANSC